MMSPVNRLRSRWEGPGGYSEALTLAFPLILSAGSWTLQHFVDRMFLCWWDPRAMGASLSAGIVQFTAVSLFMGTASYANTFVAQYHGAQRPDRIGPSVWQAIYFSLIAFCCFMALIPLSRPIFELFGHEQFLRELEISYFRILLLGSGFTVYSSAISAFYSGRGKTWPVLWVNVVATLINIVLDYVMIFGRWGFPEMGMAGAAWATVIAMGSNALIFTCMLFSRNNRREFATLRGWHLEWDLFKRLLKFGVPSGMHFMADVFVFMLFVQMIGRIGAEELTATTLAFNINMLAFLPMVGFGIATSTLVGQRLGANEPHLAERSTYSVFHMTLGYMALVALLLLIIPSVFIEPFAAQANPEEFAPIRPIAFLLLRFVAIYCVFDTMNIIFASALKGAGDTRFVMWQTFGLGLTVMVVPTYLATSLDRGAIFVAWAFLSLYVVLLGFSFLWRFKRGKWRNMRVIEPTVAILPTSPLPESPTMEMEL